MAHEGRFGYEVFELDLPESVVELYCVQRFEPDTKSMAIARIMNGMTTIDQSSAPVPKGDKDEFEAETLE